jgi:hypothetical protein
MKNQVVWVYALCYNESHFVKNFLAAYKDADKIIINDNMSDDNSVELLVQDPRVEVRTYDSGGKIRDDMYLDFKNNSWKEARGYADWVIVLDFDEIFGRVIKSDDKVVFDLNFSEPYINGFNIIRSYGYNMVSLDSPLYSEKHPFEHSQKGDYHIPSEKMCCFRPDQISEINYKAGCHLSDPFDIDGRKDGIRILFHPDYKLLHYKFWNLKLYMERMKLYQKRMSGINKKNGWGYQYLIPVKDHCRKFLSESETCKFLFDIRSPYI